MKKSIVVTSALLALSAPLACSAMDHDHMDMEQCEHSMKDTGSVAHQEVIDGVKATFKVISMKEHMKGMDMPHGMKETHHIAVAFKDAKSGKTLTEGEVKVKLQGPDKTEVTRDLMGMQGHFGADFDLSRKGKYGVMCKFQLKGGKTHSSKFWYTVK